MIAAILFALCLLPISITRAANPRPLEVPCYNLFKLFQLAPLSMASCFIAGMINGSFYSLGPMFGLDIGLTVSQVSFFMSLTIWSGLLFQFPVGQFSDRLGRLPILSAVGFTVMVVSIGIATLGRGGMGALMSLTACFAVVFTIYPVAMAWAQDNIKKEDIVPASAALIVFFGIGACLGPITVSIIMSQFGPFGLYYFTAGCGTMLCFIVFALRNQSSRNHEEQDPNSQVYGSSPLAGTIDPDGKHEIQYIDGRIPDLSEEV